MKTNYVSASESFTANGVTTFKNWVPAKGPTGRRNVIDKIVAEVTYAWTPSTANLLGENIPNICANLIVNDAGGQRRNLPGRAIRVANTKMLRSHGYREHADLATGAERTGVFRLEIPFAIERAKDGKEFAIPAELLGDIQWTWCGSSGLDYGSGTVSIGTTSLVLRAYTHEENEISLKARDFIKDEVMKTTTESTHACGGFLDYILAYKDGDELADMSAWGTTIVKPFQLLAETAAQKLYDYQEDHGAAAEITTNPFILATPKALVIHSTRGEAPKLNDHPLLKEFTVQASTGVASSHLITRVILPRNPQVDGAVMSRYGKSSVGGGPLGPKSNRFLARKAR